MANKNHGHHVLSLGLYLKVGTMLLILTVITVWVAQYDLGATNLFVAMIIAGTKASLVALFFMHLKYDNKIYATVFVGSLLFLAVFIVFTMFDTMERGRIYEIKASPIDNKAVIYHESRPAAGDAEAEAADTLFEDTLPEETWEFIE